ncbi:transglycosylase family protein [Mycolicibacterium sphagni]|uniref:transglycosylase family protein n=1 Tax=Mycolicibacterium sphagni TaxID=1786 RepID=UPI0023DF9194|nr:transglycosylase family protein [Mycolicibacterium sphagni]MCV7174941.1 transglycosylase family protein [Mycolicibacterium sphagni]
MAGPIAAEVVAEGAISLAPTIDEEAAGAAQEKMGEVGKNAGQEFIDGLMESLKSGMSNATIYDTLSNNIAVRGAMGMERQGVRLAQNLMSGFRMAMSEDETTFAQVEAWGEHTLAPIMGAVDKIVSGVAEKIPLIGGVFQDVDTAMGDSIGLARQWFDEMADVGTEWQEIQRTLASQTTDTGKIDALGDSIRNIFSSGDIVRSKDIINSIGEISTRLGLSGTELEEFTTKYSQANEILGGITLNVDNLTGVLTQFDVPAEHMTQTLNDVANIARASGMDGNKMLYDLINMGPGLQELGYNAQQAAEMISMMNKEGVPLQRLVWGWTSLTKNLNEDVEKGRFKTVQDAWTNVVEVVKKYVAAGDDSAAKQVLDNLTGGRAGAALLEAFKKGVVDVNTNIDELASKTLGDGLHEDISKGVEDTKSLTEEITKLKLQLEAAFAPSAMAIAQALTAGGDQISDWMTSNQDKIITGLGTISHVALDIVGTTAKVMGDIVQLIGPFIDAAVKMAEPVLDVMMATVQEVTGVLAHLPGGLGDSFKDANQDIGHVRGELEKLADSNINKMFQDTGGGIKDFGTMLLNQVPKIDDYTTKLAAAAKVKEAFMGKVHEDDKDPNSKMIDKSLFTADDKGGFSVGGDDAARADIVNKLHAQGIDVTLDANGVATKVTAESLASKALFEDFYKSAAGEEHPLKMSVEILQPGDVDYINQLQNALGVPDDQRAPDGVKLQVTPSLSMTPGVNLGAGGPGLLGPMIAPGTGNPSASLPGMLNPGGLPDPNARGKGKGGKKEHESWQETLLPTDAKPESWTLNEDGSIGVPTSPKLDDKPEDHPTMDALLDALGVPSDMRGPNGIVMPTSLSPTGGGMPFSGTGSGDGGALPGGPTVAPGAHLGPMPGASVTYTPDWMIQHGYPALFQRNNDSGDATNIPAQIQALAAKFGLTVDDHADTTLHGGQAGNGNSLDTSGGWAFDFSGPEANMERLNQWAMLPENLGNIAQLIHRGGGYDWGVAGGQVVGGPQGQGSYYNTGEGYDVHTNHDHIAFATMPNIDGGGVTVSAPGPGQGGPTNWVLPPLSPAPSTPALPSTPTGPGSSGSAQWSADWDAIAMSEASGNWANKSNQDGKYMGGLQFDQPTWDRYKPAGAPSNAADATKEQQIAAAEALMADRGPVLGPKAWPTTYARHPEYWHTHAADAQSVDYSTNPSGSGPLPGPGGNGGMDTPYGKTMDYNPYTNLPPWPMTPEDYEKWKKSWDERVLKDQERNQHANDAQDANADIENKIKDTQTKLDNAQAALDALHVDQMDAQTKLVQADTIDKLTKARDDAKRAHDDAVKAKDTQADKAKQDEIDSSAPYPEPPGAKKGSQVKGDHNAEALGKGLLKGLMQGIGLDGELFSDPLNWGIFKTGIAALNWGGGFLKRLGQAGPHASMPYGEANPNGADGGGSPLLGLVEGMIPGVKDMFKGDPRSRMPDTSAMPGMPGQPSAVTSAMAPSQAPDAAPAGTTPVAGASYQINNTGVITGTPTANRWLNSGIGKAAVPTASIHPTLTG